MSSNATPIYKWTIIGDPEYIDFKFQPNWIFYGVLVMTCYSIFPIFVLFKILKVFLEKKCRFRNSLLRNEIFSSFLLMQFWNLLLIIADFAMFRIPYTTIFTEYCASANPQTLLKTIVFTYFWATYASQLFTVLFCVLRVAILYSVSESKTEKLIKICPPVIIIFGMICALPHYSGAGYCTQLAKPYDFGAILIISEYHVSNFYVMFFNFCMYLSVTVIITILTAMMLVKIRRNKSISNIRSSHQNAKVEKTLTETMIIMLIPLIFSMLIMIGEISRNPTFSYILLARPVFLDARVHIATCYFYWTHPIFKKMLPQLSVSIIHNSNSNVKKISPQGSVVQMT